MPELPTQEQFVRDVRNWEIKRADRLCRYGYWGGVIYLVAGSVYANSFLQDNNRFLLWVFIPIITVGIGVLPVAFRVWHCPHCGRKLPNQWGDGGVMMSVIVDCPTCHRLPFVMESFTRLKLPSIKYSQKILCLLFLFTVWSIVALQIYSHITPEQRGGSIGGLYGLSCLCWGLPIIMVMASEMNALWKKSRANFHKCPICGEVYSPELMKYTGRCSVCASIIDPAWPPDENSPDVILPTPADLQAYRTEQTKNMISCLLFFVIIVPATGYCYFILRINFYALMALGAVFLISPVIFASIRERKLNKIAKNIFHRCPFCQKHTNGRLPFLRCPHCRRKLVRDGDDGKGGGE